MENTALSTRVRNVACAFVGTALVVVIGLLLFFHLGDRPMHNDEAVNAWFLEKLINEHSYQYDPQNYHGPSLYYIQLLISKVAGITPISIRLGVACAGVFVLMGVLAAYRRLGRWGAFSAMTVLAFSSSFVFYSRYFIHEIFLILFTLGIYLSAVYFRDLKRPIYFYLLWAATALLYATKETSVLILTVFFLSIVCAEVTARLLGSSQPFKPPRIAVQHWLIGVSVAALIWALLYSSFLTHPAGLADSVKTYMTWTKTGINSGHEKRFGYFFESLLFPYEKPILFLALLGAAAALIKKTKSGLFLLFWAVGIFLVHSIIPYKTPWLILNMLLPLALLGGYGVQTLIDHVRRRQNKLSLAAAAGTFFITGLLLVTQLPTTIAMTFLENDNEDYPQIYVHTSRDIYRLVEDVNAIAKKNRLEKDLEINIVSAIEWPLPFYLRQYPQAFFWRTFENLPNLTTPLIIAQESQHKELAEALARTRTPYITRLYSLRRGVPLEMWIRKDIADE